MSRYHQWDSVEINWWISSENWLSSLVVSSPPPLPFSSLLTLYTFSVLFVSTLSLSYSFCYAMEMMRHPDIESEEDEPCMVQWGMERERLLGSDLFVFSDKPVGRERESDWIACNLGYYTGVSKLRYSRSNLTPLVVSHNFQCNVIRSSLFSRFLRPDLQRETTKYRSFKPKLLNDRGLNWRKWQRLTSNSPKAV